MRPRIALRFERRRAADARGPALAGRAPRRERRAERRQAEERRGRHPGRAARTARASPAAAPRGARGARPSSAASRPAARRAAPPRSRRALAAPAPAPRARRRRRDGRRRRGRVPALGAARARALRSAPRGEPSRRRESVISPSSTAGSGPPSAELERRSIASSRRGRGEREPRLDALARGGASSLEAARLGALAAGCVARSGGARCVERRRGGSLLPASVLRRPAAPDPASAASGGRRRPARPQGALRGRLGESVNGLVVGPGGATKKACLQREQRTRAPLAGIATRRAGSASRTSGR